MNVNPIKGNKIIINCSNIQTKDNKLEKGQKSGDATKVSSYASVDTVDMQIPTIDSKVSTHEVSLSKENSKRRQLQMAIMRRQKEAKVELSER